MVELECDVKKGPQRDGTTPDNSPDPNGEASNLVRTRSGLEQQTYTDLIRDYQKRPEESHLEIQRISNTKEAVLEEIHKRHVVCSALYMAMNIVASIAVYPDLKKAWKTKSVEHMSLFWIVLEFMGVFGLLPLNIYIFVPNLFGIVLSAAQFIAYIVYRTSVMPPPEEYDLECCRGSPPPMLEFSLHGVTCQISTDSELSSEEQNQAIQSNEKEGVPADKALSKLHPTGPVSVEIVEQGIKEEIHREVESAATDTEDGQTPEKDLEDIKKVIEVFDLHEATGNTNQENGEKAEIQNEVQNLDSIVIKNLHLEGETVELNMRNDARDREKVPMSHIEEETEIKESRKCIQEEEKYMEEATDEEEESFPDDKATPTLPSIASIQVETDEKSVHEEIHKESESAVKDTNERQRPYNDFEENVKVLKV